MQDLQLVGEEQASQKDMRLLQSRHFLLLISLASSRYVIGHLEVQVLVSSKRKKPLSHLTQVFPEEHSRHLNIILQLMHLIPAGKKLLTHCSCGMHKRVSSRKI
jgi:hypothetical protein